MKRDRILAASLYCVALAIALLLSRYVHASPIGHDEVEHVHVSWRMLQGDLPYADFHQNHAPLVWWVGAAALRVLPESAEALLALRWLSFATFLAAMAVGWRVLVRLNPDTSALVYPIALIAMLCFAYRFEWYRFRPDVFMSLGVTLALAVMIGRPLTHARTALAGVLLGVAACFSPKVWPLLALLPLRLAWDAWHAGSVRPLFRLASYSLGGIVAALPLAVWLSAHDLWPGFLAEVVAFNGAYPKPPPLPLRFLERPLLLGALAGVVVMAWHAWTGRGRSRWPYVALAATVVLGFSIVFFGVHAALYNQQAAAIPAGIAFAFAGAALAGRRASAARLVLFALFLAISVRREVVALAGLRDDDWRVSAQELSAFADLARATEGAQCVAFAPCHPMFCPDASELSLLWDLLFLEHPDPAFRARHRQYWKDAVDIVQTSRPAIVVDVCDDSRPWEGAVARGALTEEDLARLRRTLTDHYTSRSIGRQIVWVAR